MMKIILDEHDNFKMKQKAITDLQSTCIKGISALGRIMSNY